MSVDFSGFIGNESECGENKSRDFPVLETGGTRYLERNIVEMARVPSDRSKTGA